jgi:hypothetical protein
VQFDIVVNLSSLEHTDMYFAHALPSMQSTWSNGSFTDECKVKITEKDQTLVFTNYIFSFSQEIWTKHTNSQ